MHLSPEMTFWERIDGPVGPTIGNPLGSRLCWSVTEAVLSGRRIDARLAMPGMDWLRLADDGTRRQDQRLVLQDADGVVILLSYDHGLIRSDPAFLEALTAGATTDFEDQYMRMVARFDTGAPQYSWLTQSLFLGEGRLAGPGLIEYRIHRWD